MNIFGNNEEANFIDLVTAGAIILDVRSEGEFAGGHVDESINIPLDTLPSRLNELGDTSKTIITCCLSGARSNAARDFLLENGYQNVYNGGGWNSLQRTLTNN